MATIAKTPKEELLDRYIKLSESALQMKESDFGQLSMQLANETRKLFCVNPKKPTAEEKEKIRIFYTGATANRVAYDTELAENEAKRVRESAMFADDEIENNWINKPIVEVGNFKDIENVLLQKITNDDYINNRHNYVSFNISERKSPDGDNYQWYNNDTNKPLPGYDSLLGNTKKRKIEMNNLLTNYTFSDIDDAEVALNSLKEEARINNSNEYDKDIEGIENYIKQQSRNPGRP